MRTALESLRQQITDLSGRVTRLEQGHALGPPSKGPLEPAALADRVAKLEQSASQAQQASLGYHTREASPAAVNQPLVTTPVPALPTKKAVSVRPSEDCPRELHATRAAWHAMHHRLAALQGDLAAMPRSQHTAG